jgi:hypothetical protein
MKNRLISFLAILTIAAAATPVLAQDSVMRTQSAVSMHPADCQSRSQLQTTDQSAVKEVQHERVDWPHIGMGFTVAVGNLFYIPAKIAYGTLGGVAGGAAYVFSRDDRNTANRIWSNSLGGDYVLTPAMITGQEPIHFMGSASSNSSAANAASPTRKSPLSRVSLPQSVARVNMRKTANRAVPISKEIDAYHSNPATLEISPLVDRQSGRSEAKNKRTASGVAPTPDFEGMPPMSIEPQ